RWACRSRAFQAAEHVVVDSRGGLRRFCRVLRVGMQLGEREVTEHKPQTLAEPPLQLFDHRPGFTARCTLKVAVFDERHRRRCRAGDVVSFSYWGCESAALGPDLRHLAWMARMAPQCQGGFIE